MAGVPPEELAAPGRWGEARVVLLVLGIGLAVDAGLMAAVGPDALLGAPYRWAGLASSLGAVAFGLLALALVPSPHATVRAARERCPHLLPYAPGSANAAVFLLWVVSTVSVYQGCIDIFTGAHAGGGGSGVRDPVRLQLLIVAASILFWLLALYAAVALRRLIPMGRWVDSDGGRDSYGAAVTPPSTTLVGMAVRWGPPRHAPGNGRILTALCTGLTAWTVSVGVQLVEVGTAPVPPGLWLETQAALPIYSAALALALLAADGSVRALERRFADRVRPLAPVPSAPAGPGFVQ